MTDVGKIKLGVEIDANDLSSKLGEAVRKAIAPALQEIQRELRKVQEEYDKTNIAAADAATVQKHGAKEVSNALDKVRDKQLEVAAAAKASSDSQQRDIHQTTRDWEEQTAAIAANTAARIANAAAPVGGGPGRSGGGPGRGGRSSGGGGSGGILGFLTGPVGLNTIALGVTGVPAALTAITSVTAAVLQLGQAALGLPALYGAVGASIGVALLGAHGMKDAITALGKAAGPDATAADLKKAADGLKDLSAAGKDTAIEVSKLMQGPWKDLQKGVQQHMFAGVASDIDTLNKKALPGLTTGLNSIGDSWNGTIKAFTSSLGDTKNLSLIDRFLGNTAEGQKRANAAIDPIVHAFATLTSTGGEFLPRLGDALTKVATRFDDFISKAGKSGQLWKWIDEGLNGLRALGNSILNVGKTLTGLTKAAGGDEGFLGWLEKATGKMQTFVNSADGQGKLREFFAMGRDGMHQWADLFKTLGPALLKILEGFAQWGQVTLPIVTALAELVNWLGQVPGLVQGIVVAFLAWRTIGGIIGGITSKVDGLNKSLGKGTPGGGKLNRGLLGVGLAGAGTEIQQSGGTDIMSQLLGGAATIGGSALTGATIGSVIPGIGTAAGAAVGAGVGAVLAGINVAIGENAEQAKAAAAANDKLTASIAAENQAYMLTSQAIKTLNDSLLASKGVLDPTAIAAVGDEISQIPDKLKGALGDEGAKRVGDALKGLNLTTEQLSTIVTGSGPGFDALISRLKNMGDGGQHAATQLQQLRDDTLGAAQNAQTAGPLLQTLADAMNTNIPQAAANLTNAFKAIPSNVPIKIDAPGGQDVLDILNQLHQSVTVDDKKEILVTAPLAPEVLTQLQALGIQVTQNNDKTIQVQLDQASYNATLSQLGSLGEFYKNLFSAPLPAPNAPPLPTTPGQLILPGAPRAGGGVARGVMPGYSPGQDNMLVPLSGGEGIVIPEAMRALGADWLYGVNSNFRSGISKAGYAGGGVNGYAPGGVVGDDSSVTGLLIQIRDLLAGKGGANSNPLAATAAGVGTLAQGAKGLGAGGIGAAGGLAAGTTLGPFGTPIKPRNKAYDAAAAAISALGGNPENFLGANPAQYGIYDGMGGGALGGAGGGVPAGIDYNRFASALAAFAHSGSLGDVSGLGLGVNSPVITALTSARNKKKGGLSDDDISALVQQIIGGGGFGGTLDSTNTPLVKSLQRYRDQLTKQGGGFPGVRGVPGAGPTAFGAPALGGAGGAGSANALVAFAQSTAGGKYAAASDLTDGLADCSGAVSDLVEFLTKGKASPERLFSTGNEAAVLQSLGAVPGLVPGSLQIGLNSGHTAATLPNGVNFESGGSGGGVVYGGPVGAGDKQFTQQFSLPTDLTGRVVGAGYGGGGLPGLGGGGAAGGTVPVYVTNWGGGGTPPPGAPGAPGVPPGGAAGLGNAMPPGVAQVAGAGLTAAGQAGAGVATDLIHAGAASIIPAGLIGTPTAPNTKLATLVKQGNPMAIAEAAGLNVPDYTRQGNQLTDVAGPAQPYDASGRLYSDTSSLVNRTTTDLGAQINAMRSQLVSVTGQVVTKLSDKVLSPVVSAGVTSGFGAVNAAVFKPQGVAIGQASAPIIADAVARSVPAAVQASSDPTGNSDGASLGSTIDGFTGNLFAGGGLVSGGTPGKDSVPILAQQNEWMLNTDDVAKLGGAPGVARFVGALRSGKLRKLAGGGSTQGSGPAAGSVDATVGADFFGVSQIPILGTIVNLLISVLLKVIGVNIDVRNTLNNIGTDFRSFRGDFKAFDASGRLANDTSALVDRSSTSTETAADERIRILKIVIEALIKYIIEKVIVPIMKAVANAVIQAGGAAAGAATNSAAPGAGGIVSSVIDSMGSAGVDIIAEVGTDFALAITSTLVDTVAQGLQSLLPGLVTGIFGGAGLENILGPIGTLLQSLLGGFLGIFTTILGGVGGGASTLIPGLPFDDGGIASGMGYLPKATMDDELVLSPKNTDIFTKFVGALNNGGFSGNRTVHAPITVMQAGPETADQVQDRLLSYMP